MKKKVLIGVVFGGIFLLALLMDWINGVDTPVRGEYGEGDTLVEYQISAEGILENYPYSLVVKQQKPTEEEAAKVFALAKEEIAATFYREGEDAEHVTGCVHMKEFYVDGVVSAEWFLSNYTYMDPNGVVQESAFEEEQSYLMTVFVELTYEDYQETYEFPFCIYPAKKTQKELLLSEIEKAVENIMSQKGESTVALPTQVNGIDVIWKQKRELNAWKVLGLEVAVLVLLPFYRKEKAKKEEEKRRASLKLDYPEMVQKLAILLGAGMSIKQAWNNISARYSDRRKKKQIAQKPLYEEMIRTKREIEGGKSERQAYQDFANRTGLQCYFRLARVLEMNLSKGTRQMGEQLFEETELAFEERKRTAQKLGEEASTKLLLPLMLLMAVVMAIVIAPAIMEFRM